MSPCMSSAMLPAVSWYSQGKRSSYRSSISTRELIGASSRSMTLYKNLIRSSLHNFTSRAKKYSRRQETWKKPKDNCMKDWTVDRLPKMSLIKLMKHSAVKWVSLYVSGMSWIGSWLRWSVRTTGSRGGQCGLKLCRSTAVTSTSWLATIQHPRHKTHNIKSQRARHTRLTWGHGD
jgi:hypothetical protein